MPLVPDPPRLGQSLVKPTKFYQLLDQGVFLNDLCCFGIEQELRPNSLSGKQRRIETMLREGSGGLFDRKRSIHTRLGQQKF